MSEAATSPQVLRDMNRAAVLAALRSATGGASLASVARTTGLSRPAVTRAVNALATVGLVRSVDRSNTQGSTLGRPAQYVEFRSRLGFVAGLEVGPHRVHTILADLDGATVAEDERELADDDLTPVAMHSLTACIEHAGADTSALWALGVGSPGLVDHMSGGITVAPSIPGWEGTSVVRLLREHLGCEVLIDNDMNLAALAEKAPDLTDFAYVHWDKRIGAGIVIDGQPHRGAFSAAGELGFIDIGAGSDRAEGTARAVTDGSGPFERFAGVTAIRELARSVGDGGTLIRALADVAPGDLGRVLFELRASHPAAGEVAEILVHRFCAGLSILLLLLDPGDVVIGGAMARAGDDLLAAVRTGLEGRLLTSPRIRLATHPEGAVAQGAVRLALTASERRIAAMAAR